MHLTELLPKLSPLDLLCFHGKSIGSNVIELSELLSVGNDSFSHVALIINNEILPCLEPGIWYIWESSISFSGDLGCGVKKLEDKVSCYDGSIFWLQLANNPFNDLNQREIIQEKFLKIYEVYKSRYYDLSLLDLLSAPFHPLRVIRNIVDGTLYGINYGLCKIGLLKTPDHALEFCSELVAHVYVGLGIFPQNIDPRNVTPVDFLGYDKVPKVIKDPILIQI